MSDVYSSSRCDHLHTHSVRGFEPFLVKGSYGNKYVWVDHVTLRHDPDEAVTAKSLATGLGRYAKADGTPGIRRAASYSGARVRVEDLPAPVRDALLDAVLGGRHR